MKIVILDRLSIGEDTPLDCIRRLGDTTVYESSTDEEAIERVNGADVIILNKVRVTRELIEASECLRLICVFATGYDNIDLIACRERGIGVCNVPGYSTDSVTLFTLSTVLALSSHLLEYSSFVRSGEYSNSDIPNKLTPVYHDIAGKTWGIVGYGNIGRAVGRVASALGAKVIVNKREPIEGVELVDIDNLCRESDIISLHCPLNDSSRGIINQTRIDMMKHGVILVNEARGAVINEQAVAEAVKSGRIAGFGCDVYSSEPFGAEHPYYAIKDMPNVILTPHAAWGSYESRERCINLIADNIRSFVEGKMLNRVDK